MCLNYCSPFTIDDLYVDLSLIKLILTAGLTKSPLDILTRQDLTTLSLPLFTFCTLPTGQIPLGLLFSNIHTMSPTSIPSFVECYFRRCLSVGRYSFKKRVQNSFMILLTLFHSFPVPQSLLLIVVFDGSPVVIPVKKCSGVELSTSRMSLLTDVRGLLLSRTSTWQMRVEKLSSWSFLVPVIFKSSRLLIPMRRSHVPPKCGAPGGINFHATFFDSAYFCISVVVKLLSSKVFAVLGKYKALSR